MLGYECVWDLDDDPRGNVQHVAQHGLTIDDVESAVAGATEVIESRSTGLPMLFGPAVDGQEIAVVFERIDDVLIYPVTAYAPGNR